MHADNCSVSGNSCCSRSVSIPTENLTYSVLSLFGLDHMCIFQAIELNSQSVTSVAQGLEETKEEFFSHCMWSMLGFDLIVV